MKNETTTAATTTSADCYASLVVSAAAFGATVLFTTVWKKRCSPTTITSTTTAAATSILLSSNPKKKSSRPTEETAPSSSSSSSSSSFRLVRYLSEQHSSWTDYGDDDEVFIRDFPKIELHVHLDGSFDGHFLWNYMKEHPDSLYCLPVTTTPPWNEPPKQLPVRSMVQQCQTDQDFHNLCTCRGHRSLKAMLNCFEIFLPLVRGNLELIEHLAYDFCLRQWEQNVVYTEVRYSPHLLAEGFSPDEEDDSATTPTTRVTAQAVLEAVTRGLRRGCRDFPDLTVNQILCSIAWRPDWALATVELAERYRDSSQQCPVVGVDVAAGEEMFDAVHHPDLYQPHRAMAQRARDCGLPLTLHAGESTGEHALENVRRAVLEYGAVRLGHGYRMVESAAIMQLVREHKVHVEVCPTSSVETGGWVYDDDNSDDDDDDGRGRNWKRHPAVTMLQHGVSISLSSDDPAVFHTSLAWQYRIALAKMELTPHDLVRMNLDAVDAAWCSEAEKERLRQLIRCYAKGKQIEGLDLEGHPCENMSSYVMEKSRTGSFSDRVYLNAHEYT